MNMRRKHLQKAAAWLLVAALLLAEIWLCFVRLGVDEYGHGDEQRHGVNAYEMAMSGEYLITTFHGEPDYWNLKPPLSAWSIIAGFRLFGLNAFGLRFYSAASTVLTMLAGALWLKKRSGTTACVLFQLFMIGCTLFYGDHLSRYGDADAQLMLLFTVAMLCMMESHRDVRWLYGSAVCFGLAFLTKSWHAALIPVTCFVYVCVTKVIARLKWKHYALLLFWGLLPVAPWAVGRYLYDGWTFFRQALSVDVVQRATTVHEGHPGEMLTYVKYLLRDRAVLIALGMSLAALGCMVVRRRKPDLAQWGCALWFAVPITAYSLCVSKLQWYVCVSLPAIGMLLGMNWKVVRDALAGLVGPRGGKAAGAVLCVAAAAVLALQGASNARSVMAVENDSPEQLLILRNFERGETRPKIYIDREVLSWLYDRDFQDWFSEDELCALLQADAQCVKGGLPAFEQEQEAAWLLVHTSRMDDDTLERYRIEDWEGETYLLFNEK